MFGLNKTAALDAHAKELKTIQEAVSRETSKLTDLKSNLAAAERDYTSALGNEAVTGEVGGAQKAQVRVAARRAEVEEQQKRLSALRGRLWDAGKTAAVAVLEAPAETLADEARAAAEAFADEWKRAADSWVAALSRRKQIERLTEKPLTLPVPEPDASVDVSDLLPINASLDNLRRSLSRAAGVECASPQGDEAALHGNFEHNLRALEAADRSRRSQARLASAQAEGR